MRVLLVLLTRWQVRGKENVLKHGPLLVVANHLHLADPPLLGVSLGRRAIFMAKKELFHVRAIGYFIGGFGAFPVHRGRLDRQALGQSYRVLSDGLALIMFPEGMRRRGGQPRSAFSGSALIALRSGAPLLPVGISGTEKIKGVSWVLRRPQITVNIGQPFSLPSISGKLTKVDLAEVTASIMQHIDELLPSEYRNDYKG